ncbi:FkbM family methyltransferase [Pararhodospirillum oryzae]|uniref:Methyltransferase FkbM domain-containing protein n=1 Tax=Pararhodospirillum oryzae TaxID=478448 RepID=A0A512H9M9_9PROT|nr:FkbM family methyltransferase [Pararhodospirillum oryzae]GEO82166.1 hypothetical protein ROR02_22970 [Pararhodospirillum oryzae]
MITDLTGEFDGRKEIFVQIQYNNRAVRFFAPNWLTHYRAHTMFSKEPETVAWLGEMGPRDVLLDIGANIGSYTIWAAGIQGCKVVAVEPESRNFAILQTNVFCNGLQEKVTAFCAAAGDYDGIGTLFVNGLLAGNSSHELNYAVDAALTPKDMPLRQGIMAVQVDTLLANAEIPFPTRIKIDVDGFEHQVVDGMQKTLTDESVSSVLIELDPTLPPHAALIDRFTDLGFAYDPAQVEASYPGNPHANYIFRRV